MIAIPILYLPIIFYIDLEDIYDFFYSYVEA